MIKEREMNEVVETRENGGKWRWKPSRAHGLSDVREWFNKTNQNKISISTIDNVPGIIALLIF